MRVGLDRRELRPRLCFQVRKLMVRIAEAWTQKKLGGVILQSPSCRFRSPLPSALCPLPSALFFCATFKAELPLLQPREDTFAEPSDASRQCFCLVFPPSQL